MQSGRVKQISSISNPVIKSIKSLHLKKNRDHQSAFLAEGLKLVTDAVDLGWEIKTLLFAGSFKSNSHLQAIAAKARSRGADILEVNEKVLSAVTRRDNPQMVVGVMAQAWESAAQITPGRDAVWVALDRIRDPGNLGTIIRTVDAVGAQGIVLIGETTDPYSVEAVRATMGSIFNTRLCKMGPEAFKSFCGTWPGQIVGTHLAGATDYRGIDYNEKPTLLLMGNEQQGLPPTLTELCDHLARIPMRGKADSLNLAISTGIMLYEICRNRLEMKSA